MLLGTENRYVIGPNHLTAAARILRPAPASTARAKPCRAHPYPALPRNPGHVIIALPKAARLSLRLAHALRTRSSRSAPLPHQQHGDAHAEPEVRSALEPLCEPGKH